jgi:hypothetical protein
MGAAERRSSAPRQLAENKRAAKTAADKEKKSQRRSPHDYFGYSVTLSPDWLQNQTT